MYLSSRFYAASNPRKSLSHMPGLSPNLERSKCVIRHSRHYVEKRTQVRRRCSSDASSFAENEVTTSWRYINVYYYYYYYYYWTWLQFSWADPIRPVDRLHTSHHRLCVFHRYICFFVNVHRYRSENSYGGVSFSNSFHYLSNFSFPFLL